MNSKAFKQFPKCEVTDKALLNLKQIDFPSWMMCLMYQIQSIRKKSQGRIVKTLFKIK